MDEFCSGRPIDSLKERLPMCHQSAVQRMSEHPQKERWLCTVQLCQDTRMKQTSEDTMVYPGILKAYISLHCVKMCHKVHKSLCVSRNGLVVSVTWSAVAAGTVM